TVWKSDTLTSRTIPATFVLSGVTSPRTYASSVTCSALPPSQEFQFRKIMNTTAAASSTTRTGVRYFCQSGLWAGGTCSGSAGRAGASVGFAVSVVMATLAASGAMVYLLSRCGWNAKVRGCTRPPTMQGLLHSRCQDQNLLIRSSFPHLESVGWFVI